MYNMALKFAYFYVVTSKRDLSAGDLFAATAKFVLLQY